MREEKRLQSIKLNAGRTDDDEGVILAHRQTRAAHACDTFLLLDTTYRQLPRPSRRIGVLYEQPHPPKVGVGAGMMEGSCIILLYSVCIVSSLIIIAAYDNPQG